jgi:hypothetical protein
MGDKYKKTDILHAIEGYCPRCGSNESIDVIEIDSKQDNPRAPVGEWYLIEHLHCNKCGLEFDQDYETKFVGQHRGERSVPPPDGLLDKTEILVRDLEKFIESVDLSANPEGEEDDVMELCDGYRTEFGMRKAFADDPYLSRVRQDLLVLKCYLEDGK